MKKTEGESGISAELWLGNVYYSGRSNVWDMRTEKTRVGPDTGIIYDDGFIGGLGMWRYVVMKSARGCVTDRYSHVPDRELERRYGLVAILDFGARTLDELLLKLSVDGRFDVTLYE